MTRETQTKSPFSLVLANPSRGMAVAADLLSPLRFLRHLVWPIAIFALIAGFFNWYDLKNNLDLVLDTFGFLWNLVMSMLTANLISRLVMGVTMAGYGIPPQQFGIRLLFGVIPRFYVSTGQIRQLDFPQQRRCYGAPLLARLALFAIGILTWVLLRRSGSGMAELALALGAGGLGAFLFTLNPIWRADGYHWMAAWFRMPDLREQSYRLLGLILRGKPIPEMLSARAVQGLLFYAIASIVFTALLFALVLSTIAFALEQQFRGTGVVMFGVILSMMLAFLINRRMRNRPAPRQKSVRTMAETSQPVSVSCYKTVDGNYAEANPDPSEQMARNKARKAEARTRVQTPSPSDTTSAGLEDILAPVDVGKPAPSGGHDPELESILGPPSESRPKGEFEEILEAALTTLPERETEPAPEPGPAPAPKSKPKKPGKDKKKPDKDRAEVRPGADKLDNVLKIGKAKRRKRSLWGKLLIWSVILGVLYYIAIQPYPFSVGGEFFVRPLERTQVRARTNGEIINISVHEGDWVSEGDILASLSKWREERDIDVLQADLDRLQANLDTLTDGPKPEEVMLAKQDLAAAQTRKELATQQLDRRQRLYDSNTSSLKSLEEAKTAHSLASTMSEQAQARLDLLLSPAPESEVIAARANIIRKEKELEFSKLRLKQTDIYAPAEGQVVSTMERISVGTFLREGDLLAELADSRTVIAEIEVPETEIDEAAIGAEVTLKLWSTPDEKITGTVKRVAPVAEEREFGQVVRVIVEVPNPDGRVSRNQTGYAKIIVEERPVWQVFTRVFTRFFWIELWSWLP